MLDIIDPNIYGGLSYINYKEIIVKGIKYFITIDPIICFAAAEAVGELVAYEGHQKGVYVSAFFVLGEYRLYIWNLMNFFAFTGLTDCQYVVV